MNLTSWFHVKELLSLVPLPQLIPRVGISFLVLFITFLSLLPSFFQNLLLLTGLITLHYLTLHSYIWLHLKQQAIGAEEIKQTGALSLCL